MDIIVVTFESVAVLLGIGILGFSIIVRRILPTDALGILTTLAIDIALPCLILANILSEFRPEEMPGWWTLPLWWGFFTVLAGLMTFCFSPLSHGETRREFSATLFYQNAIFFPLAVLTGMFGSTSPYIISLFLFTLFNPSLFFSTNHLFFSRKGAPVEWKKIFNSVLITTIIAAILALAGLQDFIPKFVIKTFAMVGAMTIPILMIILGGNIFIDFKNKGRLFTAEIIKFVTVKNILFPLVTLGVLFLIRPPSHIALILLLQSSVPPITAMPIMVERAGGNRNIVNQFMFSSFMASLVSIPAMVYLFERLY